MKKSESIKAVVSALAHFQAKVKFAPLDSNNPFFKSQYASLSSVLNASGKELAEAGLSYIQTVEENAMVTYLMHLSGEWISSSVPLLLTKQDMQGVGAAVTYARRIGLLSILGMVGDSDLDGNDSMEQPKQQAPRQQSIQGTHITTPSDDTITFGKFKDRKYTELTKDEIKNYVDYLQGSANKEGKGLSQNAIEFIDKARKAYPNAE